MKQLRKTIEELLNKANVPKSFVKVLESENDIFPFSVEGRKIAYLMDIGFCHIQNTKKYITIRF